MEKNYLLKKVSLLLSKTALIILVVVLSAAQTLSSDSSSSAAKKSINISSAKAASSAGFFTRVKRVFFSSKPKPQQTTPQQNKTSVSKTESEKTLSDVKIYPNPITDQVNLSYTLRHDANITIRIMDVLGNPVVTLLQQRLPAGNQSNSFSLSNRLTSGFYFIRVTIGTESIIKRISVL